MSRYVLCRYAIGQRGEIEITEQEFIGLAHAIRTLTELSDAEEKFNAFIDNYFELEQSSLQETLRAMIYTDFATARISDPRNVMNRRIVNFLSTVKLYLDSFPQHANRLFVDEQILEELKAAPSRAYDRSVSYRVMEALRNYSQHEAFPVHGWEVNFRKDVSADPTLFKVSIKPSLNLANLDEAKSFKASVLNELKKGNDPVELKPLIREYVEQLCIVHVAFRDATKPLFEKALGTISAARKRFVAEYPGSEISIVALPVDKDSLKVGDPVYLKAHVVDYLPYLMSRIGSMQNYARRKIEY